MTQTELIEEQLEQLHCMDASDCDRLIIGVGENKRKIKKNINIYYDEKIDQIFMERYYRNISANATPSELYEQLQNLVIQTHEYQYPYYISKDQYLYTWVDLHPNGQLKSIYSGRQKDAEEVIEEDFEMLQRRYKKYRQLLIKDRFPEVELEQQVIEISREYRFNAEHVVPQSWFGAREPMKGDLHHLFACEPRCNNVRSNFPYFEFDTNPKEGGKNHCGIYEYGRFEPDYGKGIVARATFYFLLRYPRKIKRRFLKKLDLPLLCRWHEQHPVTEYEKHRNKAIFEIQGNRNPFIDFPSLTNKITFPYIER